MADEQTPRNEGTRAEQTLHSGAPEYGGATTHGSMFGGRSLQSMALRMIARLARTVGAAAYRRLRDLDVGAGEPAGRRGRPNRVREAGTAPRPVPSPEERLHPT